MSINVYRICRLVLIAVTALGIRPAAAQLMEGELRIAVHDPSGRPVPAHVVLASQNPQFQTEAEANSEGRVRLSRLPRGVYLLSVTYQGFAEYGDTVEIRSALPQEMDVELSIGTLATEITVAESAPLLDRAQPTLVMQAGPEQLDQTPGTTLGRSTVDVITTLPGWLLEANAVMHPRGSEYDTQFVVDGMPLYDNRSIGFAPAFENGEFEAVNVITGGIPAEYGRRLGGIIALDTRRVGNLSHTTESDFQVSGYGTYAGSLTHQYRTNRTSLSLGGQAGHTGRYLDPPSLENFTNKASSAGYNGRFDVDVSERDRLSFYLRSDRTGFLVPNDLVQQAAGQRQDRRSAETAGQVHYQHTFSANALASVRGMVRDLTAQLWSNAFSTPVHVEQDRGFREGALNGAVTFQEERHTLKIGGDVRVSDLREEFRFAEPDELPEFDVDFSGSDRATDSSFFIQDHVRLGNFAANVGLRVDRYSLKIDETAVSPRLATSYYVPAADLLLRASYDRIFQPPPSENLLLSSAAAGLGIEDVEGSIAVPASRGHFYEIGFRKPVGNRMRLDVSHYWRIFSNSTDDDVFLNTGLSFPITWDHARVEGTEVRLDLPRWHGISSTLSYSNMLGTTGSPVTGGLFVRGGEAVELRDVAVEFPITQDQRNTLAGHVRFEPNDSLWFMAGVRYGSGLPVELEDDDDSDTDVDDHGDDDEADDVQMISQDILDRIDFERGRVKPNFSLDLSFGVRVWESGRRQVSLQFDLRNATDRLNVINFSGLFSGTALATGRLATFQLTTRF